MLSQAYCSGISVAYSGCAPSSWRSLAQLVLDAAYEATLYLGIENALRHPDAPGARKVYLTALGGGVFGNDMDWIIQAMARAFSKFKDVGLEVRIVSYGHRSSVFCAVGAC
uniref:ATP citrate synthase n=1 Tax=Alexandrium andersonii TaxID=327968 RepID=A0A7S2HIE1_9DINO